jgi:hypothetical protein
MSQSKFLRVAAAILLWLSQYSAFAQAPAPSSPRLVFTRAEPVEQSLLVRDERMKVMNLKMWFKNEGQSAARLLSIGIMPALTDKVLTAAEEEEDFAVATTQWSVKLDGEVKPGQTAAFASQNGVDDEGWAAFQAKQKYLYSFVTLRYSWEKSDGQGDIVTETCVRFKDGDVNSVENCQAGHNQVRERGK